MKHLWFCLMVFLNLPVLLPAQINVAQGSVLEIIKQFLLTGDQKDTLVIGEMLFDEIYVPDSRYIFYKKEDIVSIVSKSAQSFFTDGKEKNLDNTNLLLCYNVNDFCEKADHKLIYNKYHKQALFRAKIYGVLKNSETCVPFYDTCGISLYNFINEIQSTIKPAYRFNYQNAKYLKVSEYTTTYQDSVRIDDTLNYGMAYLPNGDFSVQSMDNVSGKKIESTIVSNDVKEILTLDSTANYITQRITFFDNSFNYKRIYPGIKSKVNVYFDSTWTLCYFENLVKLKNGKYANKFNCSVSKLDMKMNTYNFCSKIKNPISPICYLKSHITGFDGDVPYVFYTKFFNTEKAFYYYENDRKKMYKKIYHKGNLQIQKNYDESGKLSQYTSYSYFKDGRLSEIKEYVNGKLIRLQKFQYFEVNSF